jgi:hypothetical protein
MLSERAKVALVDIRDNILLAQQFTQGMSFEVVIAEIEAIDGKA